MQFKDGLYPALSLEEGNLVRVNVGQRPFAYDVKKLMGNFHKLKRILSRVYGIAETANEPGVRCIFSCIKQLPQVYNWGKCHIC